MVKDWFNMTNVMVIKKARWGEFLCVFDLFLLGSRIWIYLRRNSKTAVPTTARIPITTGPTPLTMPSAASGVAPFSTNDHLRMVPPSTMGKGIKLPKKIAP